MVTLEETTLAYTGPTKAANGQPLTLSGVLGEDGVTSISGRTVTFTIGSGGSAQPCSGTTNTSGQASCTIASVNQPASATTVPVSAVFAGDPFYQPASASATLRFQFMTGRDFGLTSSGLVDISPTPDTGSVATSDATTVAPPCALTLSGLITAHTNEESPVPGADQGLTVNAIHIKVLGLLE